MQTFDMIATILGVITGIWALLDPNNGLIPFIIKTIWKRFDIKIADVNGSVKPNKEKASKQEYTLPKIEIRVPQLVRHLILIILFYSIFAASHFMSLLYAKRNYSFIPIYYPKSIFDFNAPLNFYNVFSANDNKLSFFEYLDYVLHQGGSNLSIVSEFRFAPFIALYATNGILITFFIRLVQKNIRNQDLPNGFFLQIYALLVTVVLVPIFLYALLAIIGYIIDSFYALNYTTVQKDK